MVGVTLLCAGGGNYRFSVAMCMLQLGQSFILNSFAYCTGISSVTGSVLGRLSGNNTLVPAMAQSRNFVVLIAVTTVSAGVGGVTSFGTGRSSYGFGVAVTLLFSFGCTASGTSLGSSTGSILPSMVCRISGGEGLCGLITAAFTALVVNSCVFAISRTLQVLSVNLFNHRMTQRSTLSCTARGASLGGSAGCVTEFANMDNRQGFSLGCAAGAAGKGLYTGFSFGRFLGNCTIIPGVIFCTALGCTASRTSLRSGTGCVLPAVAQRSYFITGIAVTARTSIGSITIFGTSRRSNYCRIAVLMQTQQFFGFLLCSFVTINCVYLIICFSVLICISGRITLSLIQYITNQLNNG